jgi:hypothetical protein
MERAATGRPLSELVNDRLLFVGILAQVIVAVLVATLLVWLGRAAEAVGRALGRGRLPRPVRVLIHRPAAAGRPTSRPHGARGIRAPPRPQTA